MKINKQSIVPMTRKISPYWSITYVERCVLCNNNYDITRINGVSDTVTGMCPYCTEASKNNKNKKEIKITSERLRKLEDIQ